MPIADEERKKQAALEALKMQKVDELKAMRKHPNYKVNLKLLVDKQYDDEEAAKAIFIHMAMSSLGETDQIIILGAWGLLPQCQAGEKIGERRDRVKELIDYKGQSKSLDGRENAAIEIIVNSYLPAFQDSEIWDTAVQKALEAYYDGEKKKAILPVLPSKEQEESAETDTFDDESSFVEYDGYSKKNVEEALFDAVKTQKDFIDAQETNEVLYERIKVLGKTPKAKTGDNTFCKCAFPHIHDLLVFRWYFGRH